MEHTKDIDTSLLQMEEAMRDPEEETIQESYKEARNKEFVESLPDSGSQQSIEQEKLQITEATLQYMAVNHETEISERGEEGLPELFDNCKKHPQHADFIEVKSFKLDDLPESHRKEELFQLIKVTADLVVRISVQIVSENRPEFWPDTQKEYPFYTERGSTALRTGTGEIVVHKFKDGRGCDVLGSSADLLGNAFETEYKTCPCERCRNTDRPSNVWWEFTVATAAHVVFDETEAKATSCRLFFDEKRSPKIILDKFTLGFVDIKRDVSELTYITCDSAQGEEMYSKVVHWADLWKKVNKNSADRSTDMLTFIVSHPHGLHKHITIGQCEEIVPISEINDELDFVKLTYTTATCPGSSGASVHCLGFGGGHVHAGVTDSQLNLSGLGYYRKSKAT